MSSIFLFFFTLGSTTAQSATPTSSHTPSSSVLHQTISLFNYPYDLVLLCPTVTSFVSDQQGGRHGELSVKRNTPFFGHTIPMPQISTVLVRVHLTRKKL